MKEKRFYIILGTCFIALILLKYFQPKPLDWSPSFSSIHKKPYGNYILFERLPDLFPAAGIEVSRSTVSEFFRNEEKKEERSNFLIINDNVQFTLSDENRLLDFVGEGNNVFVSSNYLSYSFLDTLEVVLTTVFAKEKDSVSLVVNGVDGKFKSFGFKHAFPRFIEQFNAKTSEALGWIDGERTVLIKVNFGKGYFLVSSTPFAFTNYHMLSNDNHQFVSAVLSHLPLNNCIWDEYYKTGRVERISRSPLRAILASPSLKMAYYLSLFSLITFMAFKLKRRQKLIPILAPNTNTSLDFIRTVGQLYHQKASHSDLIEKKWTYFLTDIREKFGLSTQNIDEEFTKKLAALSGIEPSKIKHLFGFFKELLKKKKNTDSELIKLNDLINEFNKTSKR